MTPTHVRWEAHASSIRHRIGADREAAEGYWLDTVMDHDRMAAAVVVARGGKVMTVRLEDIQVLEGPDPAYTAYDPGQGKKPEGNPGSSLPASGA